MKSRKSQIMGQVFIFMLAAMLFILILSYGYRAIAGFGERSEQVALIEFQSKLENSVKSMSSDYGSVRRLELQIPASYDEACFVGDNIQPADADAFAIVHPLMYDAWLGGGQNVFLRPMAEAPINVGQLNIAEGYLCLNITAGRIVLRMEGLGRETGISKWVE